MLNKARFTLDQTTHCLRIERRIAATPDWLFKAWVTPEILTLWWDPNGAPLALCEVDLRVGGALRLVNAGQADHAFTGIYRRIDPPHRLEFDAMGACGSVTFQSEGQITLIGGGNPRPLGRASDDDAADGRG